MTTDINKRAPGGKGRKKQVTGTAKKISPRSLQLKGQLDIREVNNLKPKLARLLEGSRSVTLNTSKLEKIDTSIMQLLTAFCLSANTKGIEVIWQDPNDRLLRAAELLGLSHPLGLDLENNGPAQTD